MSAAVPYLVAASAIMIKISRSRCSIVREARQLKDSCRIRPTAVFFAYEIFGISDVSRYPKPIQAISKLLLK